LANNTTALEVEASGELESLIRFPIYGLILGLALDVIQIFGGASSLGVGIFGDNGHL